MIRSKFPISTLTRLLFTKSKTLISPKTLFQSPLLTTQPHRRQFCISIEDAHRSIQDLLAQVEKEKLRRDSNVRPAGTNVDGKKVEEEDEEEDYMGVSAEIEKLEKKIAKENDVRGKIGGGGDIVWEMDEDSESESEDDDDDEERAKDMRLKEEKILKRKIARHKKLMNAFVNSGTLDDAFKSTSNLDKFEEKHFHLRPEYRVIGELLNRFKVATGKDKFLLAQKLNRAMRLVEKREAFDPNNPANYSVIQREEVGPSVEVMDDADVDMNREAIKGDNEEEDFDDMKERDNILLEKLTAIDKKLEEKLAALDHTFGKKGKLLEEEIRELAEERNSLTEKKIIPMYRKGFDVHLIDMNRTCKVTKGGQVVKYTAILACGNYNGVVGYAKAKGPAVPIALQKAYEKCFQNLHYVDRYEDHTIAHAIQTTYKKTKVYLWPAGTTTGMKAGRTVQTILNLAGYKNVKSKVIGSRNPHNTVKALFQALNAIETPKDVQEKFGRTVVESYLL